MCECSKKLQVPGRRHEVLACVAQKSVRRSLATVRSRMSNIYDEIPALRLPRLEHLPVYVPEQELKNSARGRLALDFALDPNSPRAADTKLVAQERNILSIRERSSYQLRDCFIPDTKPPPMNDAGRFTTRSQMLAMRKANAVQHSLDVWSPRVHLSSRLPIGVTPGAPGRNPETPRFNHLQTSKGHAYWWGASAL